MRDADVVQVHFWNTPELIAFMRELTAPSRVLLWSHVAGTTPPHLLTPSLLDWADITVATSASLTGSVDEDGLAAGIAAGDGGTVAMTIEIGRAHV